MFTEKMPECRKTVFKSPVCGKMYRKIRCGGKFLNSFEVWLDLGGENAKN